MKKDEITKAIGTIGYDILDNFVVPEPDSGVSDVVADLYLVSVSEFFNEKRTVEVINKICEHYGIEDEDIGIYLSDAPIALIALYIMENGNYFKN